MILVFREMSAYKSYYLSVASYFKFFLHISKKSKFVENGCLLAKYKQTFNLLIYWTLEMKPSKQSQMNSDRYTAASTYDWSNDAKSTHDSFFSSFDSKPKKTIDSQVNSI